MKKALLIVAIIVVVGIVYALMTSSPSSTGQSSGTDHNKTASASSASELDRFDPVINRLIEAINNQDYQAVYQSYAQNMKDAFPLPKTTTFYRDMVRQFGKNNRVGEKQFVPPNKVICPLYFERGVLDLTIVLDSQDKIIGLSFIPNTQKKT